MRPSSRLAWMLAVLTLLCTKLAAGEPLAWESNLEHAQQTAAQTNRLVLLHFWASSCGPCKWMDAEVFSQPDVARQIQANYVPVKIDYVQYPELAKKFGVSGLPTDVILTPQGQVVNIAQGKAADAAQYVARLNHWSAIVRQQNAGMPASLPAGTAAANVNSPAINPPLAAAPTNTALPNPAAPQPVAPAPAYGQSLSLNGPANGVNAPSPGAANYPPLANNTQPAGNANIDQAVATLMQRPPAVPGMTPPNAPMTASTPNAPPMNAPSMNPPPANVQSIAPPTAGQPMNMQQRKDVQLPPGSPPLALDGYCAVNLTEKQHWIRGDVRYGVYHRGRTYLFTGPDEQNRFRTNYDRYAPVCSGDDIVLATEEHKAVPGLREHGVFFADHIFLFANESTLQKFSSNPYYYAGQAMGTMHQAASAGQQPR